MTLLPRVAAGLGRLQNHAAALRTCRRIIALRPTHHAAHFGVVYYLARLDRPAADTVPPLRGALRLCPGNLIYRLNLAAAYVRIGRLADAHTLAADVSPERLPCPGWAAQLLPAIEWGGDPEMAAAYRRAAGGADDAGQ